MVQHWFIKLILISCTADSLNDAEYKRMPPIWSMDEYESCLIEEGSTYCMMQLTLYAESGNDLMNMIIQYSDQTFINYNHTVIERGVCLKKTCQNLVDISKTAEDLRASLEACLSHSLRNEYGLSAKVSTLYYCEHHNDQEYFNAWDWSVLVMILAFLTINIAGSFYDYYLSKNGNKYFENGNLVNLFDQRKNSFLLCLSVKQNWKMLISETSNKTRDLQFLYGLRALCNICTVIFHVMMGFKTFIGNPHDVEKLFEQPLYYLIIGGQNMVQAFLFFSGFLIGYQLQVDDERYKSSIWNWPTIVMKRVCRFVPALAITLALTSSWTRHMGSGPLWRLHVTDSLVAECRSYWWHNLLFINNYVQGGRLCLSQTWHLAAEMQVFLVGVAVYLVSPKVMLPAALLLSAIIPALHTAFKDMYAAVRFSPEIFRTWKEETFWGHYIQGHNNLSCYIIGIMTAMHIFVWQKQGKHLVQSKWWNFLRYVSLGAILLPVYSGRLFYVQDRPGIWVRAVYSGTFRVLLGLACALLTYAFVNKTPSLFKSFLEWRWWVVPSRLSYCVFLVHMPLVHIIMGSRTEPSIFSIYNLISASCVVIVTSYLLAILLHLLVEAPCTTLCKKLAFYDTSVISSVTITDIKDKRL